MQEDVPTRPVNTSPDDPDPNETLWLVSYADDDDREMTAQQIFQAMRRGEIDGDTIVWRDGMAEWQAISDVHALQQALHRAAGRGTIDKKRTVLGGFQAHPRPPRPDSAPRNTLIGGHTNEDGPGSERARGLSHSQPTPGVGDLDEDLDAELLESVRPPRGAMAQRLAMFPSNTETAPLPDVTQAFDRPAPSDPDSAPISLDPDSIESLPSNALESVVAQLPPPQARSSPSNIFEVAESEPPAPTPLDDETRPMEPKVRPRPPLRDRSVMPAPSSTSEQEREASLAPAAPTPRKSRAGSVFLVLLLLGAMGGAMFYVGQQTARQQLATSQTPPTPTALAAEPADPDMAAETSAPAETTAPTGAAAPTEADGTEASDSAESAADGAEAAADEGRAEPAAPARRPSAATPVVAARPARARPSPSPSPAPDTPGPAPEPKPATESGGQAGPFNTGAASAALTSAAQAASSCRKAGDPSGVANVTVTFAPSGRAINANVQGPPFAGTVTGGCIASKMRSAKVPPFSGERITVKKVVVIQ